MTVCLQGQGIWACNDITHFLGVVLAVWGEQASQIKIYRLLLLSSTGNRVGVVPK